MATHLVLLHHGWQGHPRGDFTDDFVNALTKSSPASTLIHNVSANHGLDSEGVHACAERLCDVIELLKHDNPALQSITMIGVSFGGIVLRYTAAQLFDGLTSLMCGRLSTVTATATATAVPVPVPVPVPVLVTVTVTVRLAPLPLRRALPLVHTDGEDRSDRTIQ